MSQARSRTANPVVPVRLLLLLSAGLNIAAHFMHLDWETVRISVWLFLGGGLTGLVALLICSNMIRRAPHDPLAPANSTPWWGRGFLAFMTMAFGLIHFWGFYNLAY